MRVVVPAAGVEPATFRSGGERSNPLSYAGLGGCKTIACETNKSQNGRREKTVPPCKFRPPSYINMLHVGRIFTGDRDVAG